MFRIKVCGITTVEDALLAAAAGADAIGLNFYEKSRRCITPAMGGWIAQALAREFTGRVRLVGVFVNATPESWLETAQAAGLDDIQLHGDEPPAALVRRNWPRTGTTALKKDCQLIRAFRCASSSLEAVGEYLQDCKKLRALPDAVLVDAHEPGSYGGTGLALDWNAVRKERDRLLGLPLVLAGGLTAENVSQAIVAARPEAVDVASGVESAPGRKDASKVRDFVAAARQAFRGLGQSK